MENTNNNQLPNMNNLIEEINSLEIEINDKMCKREDLLKNNKIKFIEINYKARNIEDIKSEYDNLYLYITDSEEKLYTINGLNELTKKELDHFENFFNDYFYYRFPFYKNAKDEMSECEMVFENDSSIKVY